MTGTPDIAHLRQWIGREDRAADRISPQMVKAFRAMLDQEPGEPEAGEPAPLAIHWCLAPLTAPMAALGPDGHPARGGFLPPVPLPRRMWAGGELRLADRLLVDDQVERLSTIEAVELKKGRSGPLCFVTVRHEFSTGRGTAIVERQDIVYRPANKAPAAPTTPEAQSALADRPAAERSWRVEASPVLLFRYSALTFNGHRIHYDRSYCQDEEFYPGLVVHGPLQATLLLNLATAMQDGRPPGLFRFRGVHPLFDGAAFTVNARRDGDRLDLWTADATGRKTMTATA